MIHVMRVKKFKGCVNALSGLYLISTKAIHLNSGKYISSVNALSGLYLISTAEAAEVTYPTPDSVCQCPLGLIPHFYGTSSKT